MSNSSTEMNDEFPLIIALQGDPFTGKTTLANSLTQQLKCPVIRFDEILDVISSHEPHPPTTERSETLMSNAFDIITQIVKTHASFKYSVVIDSPLSRISHLNKLVNLLPEPPCVHATEVEKDYGRLRIVLIQCKPKTEYSWQMRFEEHDFSLYQNKWYKPKDKTWPMDPVFGRDYTDNDINPIVSKLVVDTTDHVPLDRLLHALRDLSIEPEGSTFELKEWIRSGEFSEVYLAGKRTLHSVIGHRDKRHWMQYWEEGIDYEATCEICDNNVDDSSGAVYSCFICPLIIHKACAEIDNIDFPKFQLQDNGFYVCPEGSSCTFCKEEGNEFSYDCLSCVFKCYIKWKLVPTIVNHPGHSHRLCFQVRESGSYKYFCSACKRPGEHAGYYCLEKCTTDYHPECALLPKVFTDHEHSGHKHDLELVFCRDEELEDYICGMCLDKMNPDAWYYYCHDCYLPLHLDCAFKDFDA